MMMSDRTSISTDQLERTLRTAARVKDERDDLENRLFIALAVVSKLISQLHAGYDAGVLSELQALQLTLAGEPK